MFHVGDVVRRLRQQRGWTSLQLARRARVAPMTLSAIERGESHTRDRLDAVAHAFDLPDGTALEARLYTWALLFVGEPSLIDDDVREWLAFYKVLENDVTKLRSMQTFLRAFVRTPIGRPRRERASAVTDQTRADIAAAVRTQSPAPPAHRTSRRTSATGNQIDRDMPAAARKSR